MPRLGAARLAAWGAASLGYLLIWLVNAGPAPVADLIAPALFGALLTALARLGAPVAAGAGLRWPWPGPLALAGGALAGALYLLSGATAAAWGMALAWHAGLIWAYLALLPAAPSARPAAGRRPRALLLALALAAVAGGGAALAGQVEAQFAEEEFFVALEALLLGAGWLAALGAALALGPPRQPTGGTGPSRNPPLPNRERGAGRRRNAVLVGSPFSLKRRRGQGDAGQTPHQNAIGKDMPSRGAGLLPHHAAMSPPAPARGSGGQGVRAKSASPGHKPLQDHGAWRRGLTLPRPRLRYAAPAALALALPALWGALRAYQGSFFDPDPPGYPGISAQTPFLCGTAAPAAQTYAGGASYAALLDLVERHPLKGPPEYGMLALGRRDQASAAAFRRLLLEEAAAGRFTGPANSVKYGQYEAALRAYYYDQVRAAFPDLFSAEDTGRAAAWFAAINRRALTVEWVDWLYSAAFGAPPAGPYANQESGAALLSTLERTGLADPALAEANRAYLAGRAGGWAARFRNTDDTYYYQLEWLNNAYLQALGGAAPPPAQVRRSLDWLLLQALPDGAPLRYNFPVGGSPAGAAYLGAQLLGDPQYLWLAGRAAEAAAADPGFAMPQPGPAGPLDLAGRSPTAGACLIYGDSGLPTRAGPLAPDKIVFRDGWEPGARYLLLNLRFSGWHRYKGTNSISLIYAGGPLVADDLAAGRLGWLPVGRSAFRDKRIPRERLSGLLVGRSGLSAVLRGLTGLGGAWAQDPPRSAVVRDFRTGPVRDESLTEIRGWRGWTQRRQVLFYHDGPIVVLDRAEGPAGARAALSWSLAEPGPLVAGRVALRGGAQPAELLLLGLTGELRCESRGAGVICASATPGRLAAAGILLSGDWVGAQAEVRGDVLRISQGARELRVPIDQE